MRILLCMRTPDAHTATVGIDRLRPTTKIDHAVTPDEVEPLLDPDHVPDIVITRHVFFQDTSADGSPDIRLDDGLSLIRWLRGERGIHCPVVLWTSVPLDTTIPHDITSLKDFQMARNEAELLGMLPNLLRSPAA
jgi:hypothetical protein